MNTTTNYSGRVVKIGNPKLYHGPYGPYRQFFVQFEDGRKAMFAAIHHLKFSIGDSLIIEMTEKNNWILVSERAEVSVMKNNSPDTVSDYEIGYVTRIRDEPDGKFYVSFSPKPLGTAPVVDVVRIPVDIIPKAGIYIQIPDYSVIRVIGEARDRKFTVKKFIAVEPVTTHGYLAIPLSSLDFRPDGADFFYRFGPFKCRGHLSTPFETGIIYNLIKEKFHGFVTLNGEWRKRGYWTRDDNGVWHEDIYWEPHPSIRVKWGGTGSWEITELDQVIRSEQADEKFLEMVRWMEGATPRKVETYVEQFEKIGHRLTYEHVLSMFYRAKTEERYLEMLREDCGPVTSEYVSSNGLWYYVIDDKVIAEVPEGTKETLIFRRKGDEEKQITEISIGIKNGAFPTDREASERSGYITTIPHSDSWENSVRLILNTH